MGGNLFFLFYIHIRALLRLASLREGLYHRAGRHGREGYQDIVAIWEMSP